MAWGGCTRSARRPAADHGRLLPSHMGDERGPVGRRGPVRRRSRQRRRGSTLKPPRRPSGAALADTVHTELVGTLPFDVEDEAIQHVKTLLVANKADAEGAADRLDDAPRVVRHQISESSRSRRTGGKVWTPCVAPSYDLLGVIRVYTKIPGKPADRTKPFTVPIGSTVLDLAREVHRDFEQSLKFAKIWGTGVFEGQTVKRDHELHDADIVSRTSEQWSRNETAGAPIRSTRPGRGDNRRWERL